MSQQNSASDDEVIARLVELFETSSKPRDCLELRRQFEEPMPDTRQLNRTLYVMEKDLVFQRFPPLVEKNNFLAGELTLWTKAKYRESDVEQNKACKDLLNNNLLQLFSLPFMVPLIQRIFCRNKRFSLFSRRKRIVSRPSGTGTSVVTPARRDVWHKPRVQGAGLELALQRRTRRSREGKLSLDAVASPQNDSNLSPTNNNETCLSTRRKTKTLTPTLASKRELDIRSMLLRSQSQAPSKPCS